MTVGMNRLNQMFRDFKVAEDVGKMIELRRFEIEFEVYGTVYWEENQRYYLVSKNEELLYGKRKELGKQNKYPLPVQIWREKRLVPAGWEEDIEQDVKINLCRYLQKAYPESFWENILSVADSTENDVGVKVLDPIQEQLEGIFQADQLQLFDELSLMLYLRKNLTKNSYCNYQKWLKEIQQEMINDIKTKDIFSKKLFGFAYQKQGEQIQYQLNASQRLILEKRERLLCQNDILVAPVFYQKIWYNYDYRLEQARNDFREKMKYLFDNNYFSTLQKIKQLPITVDQKLYFEILKNYQDNGNHILAEAWSAMGREWGICIDKAL